MVKTLRYTLMAVVAMVANFSFAQTTIDFTKQTATLKDKVGYTLTAEGYTFEADKAAGTTVPTQNTNKKDLRHYAKNTLTISGPAMKEIVFTMSAAGKKQWGDVTPSEGQVTVDTENGITTWTNTNGSTTVTFTVGTDNTYGSNKKKTAAQFDLALSPVMQLARQSSRLISHSLRTPSTMRLAPSLLLLPSQRRPLLPLPSFLTMRL